MSVSVGIAEQPTCRRNVIIITTNMGLIISAGDIVGDINIKTWLGKVNSRCQTDLTSA